MLSKFARILIVDDSRTMRRLVATMLRRMGYENLHEASDGQQALALLSRLHFALVISDWNMQRMDGLTLLQELRKLSPTRTVPFVMMTAHAVKFVTIARGNGAIHYLVKPFSVDQLAEKMLLATSGRAA